MNCAVWRNPGAFHVVVRTSTRRRLERGKREILAGLPAAGRGVPVAAPCLPRPGPGVMVTRGYQGLQLVNQLRRVAVGNAAMTPTLASSPLSSVEPEEQGAQPTGCSCLLAVPGNDAVGRALVLDLEHDRTSGGRCRRPALRPRRPAPRPRKGGTTARLLWSVSCRGEVDGRFQRR